MANEFEQPFPGCQQAATHSIWRSTQPCPTLAEGEELPTDTERVDNEDGSYTLNYNVTIAGTYDIRVLLGGACAVCDQGRDLALPDLDI